MISVNNFSYSFWNMLVCVLNLYITTIKINILEGVISYLKGCTIDDGVLDSSWAFVS